MTRDDQISIGMLNTFKKEHRDMEIPASYKHHWEVGFETGAKWADEHPDWHLYPEEKPEYKKDFLLILSDGSYFVDSWLGKEHGWSLFNKHTSRSVVKWMDLPKSR